VIVRMIFGPRGELIPADDHGRPLLPSGNPAAGRALPGRSRPRAPKPADAEATLLPAPVPLAEPLAPPSLPPEPPAAEVIILPPPKPAPVPQPAPVPRPVQRPKPAPQADPLPRAPKPVRSARRAEPSPFNPFQTLATKPPPPPRDTADSAPWIVGYQHQVRQPKAPPIAAGLQRYQAGPFHTDSHSLRLSLPPSAFPRQQAAQDLFGQRYPELLAQRFADYPAAKAGAEAAEKLFKSLYKAGPAVLEDLDDFEEDGW